MDVFYRGLHGDGSRGRTCKGIVAKNGASQGDELVDPTQLQCRQATTQSGYAVLAGTCCPKTGTSNETGSHREKEESHETRGWASGSISSDRKAQLHSPYAKGSVLVRARRNGGGYCNDAMASWKTRAKSSLQPEICAWGGQRMGQSKKQKIKPFPDIEQTVQEEHKKRATMTIRECLGSVLPPQERRRDAGRGRLGNRHRQ